MVIQVFLGLAGSSKIQHKLNYNDVKRFFWTKASFKYEFGQKIKSNYAGLEKSVKSIQEAAQYVYRLYKAKCLPIGTYLVLPCFIALASSKPNLL